jgi:hypothetical protein
MCTCGSHDSLALQQQQLAGRQQIHRAEQQQRAEQHQLKQLVLQQQPTLEDIATASQLWVQRAPAASCSVASSSSGDEVPVLQAFREWVSLLTVYSLRIVLQYV